jgi:hypothetical protein
VKDDLEKTIMREEKWDFDACLKCSDRESEYCKECNKGRVLDSGWREKTTYSNAPRNDYLGAFDIIVPQKYKTR